jgi:hypothetical protein
MLDVVIYKAKDKRMRDMYKGGFVMLCVRRETRKKILSAI